MAVILPQTSLQDGLLVADRIRACIESAAYTHNDLGLSVTVSIGITSVCGRHPTVETFVGEVDKALYRAKAEGRNRVVIAEGLSLTARPANYDQAPLPRPPPRMASSWRRPPFHRANPLPEISCRPLAFSMALSAQAGGVSGR